MNKHKQSEHRFSASEATNLRKRDQNNSRISKFVTQAHSVNTLHLIASCCQIFLGLSVLVVSILGFIKPVWVSDFLSLLGSITVMLGFYFLYTVLIRNINPNRLLSEAMKRVIDAQN